MLKGRSVLRELDGGLEEARSRHQEAAEALRRVEDRQRVLLEEDRVLLDELARVYLPDLSPESVSAGLDVLRGRLERALAAQEERQARLSDEAVRAAERVAAERGRVEALEAEAEALAEELDEARVRVEAVLDADETHDEQVAEHTAIMAVRERLRRRRTRLGAAASAERHHYESDRLFRYLHDRGYGGPGYRAGPLTRRLDRWLANRIDYEILARNYRILKVGPHQIGAEIRRLARRASELEGAADAREEEVARQEGLLALLERRVEIEALLSEAQAELDRARSAREAVDDELRALEANRGRHFEEALQLHREYLEGRSVRELEELVRSTPDPRGDELVRRLERVRRELAEEAREMERLQEEMQRADDELERISSLHRAGVHRFGRSRSVFPDGFDVHPVIEAFMAGRAGPDEVIQELADSHGQASIVVEMERPYFDAVFREMAAACDATMGEDVVVEAEWEVEGEVETEIAVHDSVGRIIRRRVTRRGLGPGPEEGGT